MDDMNEHPAALAKEGLADHHTERVILVAVRVRVNFSHRCLWCLLCAFLRLGMP